MNNHVEYDTDVEADIGTVGKVSGVVNWFNAEKGYGFITADSGESAFVHHRSIQMAGYRDLDGGDAVSFYLMPSAKGWSAQGVTIKESE